VACALAAVVVPAMVRKLSQALRIETTVKFQLSTAGTVVPLGILLASSRSSFEYVLVFIYALTFLQRQALQLRLPQ